MSLVLNGQKLVLVLTRIREAIRTCIDNIYHIRVILYIPLFFFSLVLKARVTRKGRVMGVLLEISDETPVFLYNIVTSFVS